MKTRAEMFQTVVQLGADAYFKAGRATIDQYVHACLFAQSNISQMTYYLTTCDGPTGTTARLEAAAAGFLKWAFEGAPKPELLVFAGL
jgi:hypothetical protein